MVGMGVTNRDRRDQFMVQDRRLMVAQLINRGFKDHEICKMLAADPKHRKPDGKPWSISTIKKDRAAMIAEIKAQLAESKEEWRARIIGELQELGRAAWAAKEYTVALKVIAQLCDLLGLNEPVKVDITHDVLRIAEVLGIEGQSAIAEVERIINESR